ncbi:MAG TPA: hypothetical protein VKD26_06305 [Streptosporangiaceae bacterium]|nr:hypothetical protein [Streptosporangiaceae bacterium]
MSVSARAAIRPSRAWAAARRSAARAAAAARCVTAALAAARPWPGGTGDVADAVSPGQGSAPAASTRTAASNRAARIRAGVGAATRPARTTAQQARTPARPARIAA